MGKLSSRLDGMEKLLEKITPKAGSVVIIKTFNHTPDQTLIGYRDLRTGAVRSVDEADWPPLRAGVQTVLQEVYEAPLG